MSLSATAKLDSRRKGGHVHDDTDSGPPTSGRSSDSRLGLEGRSRKRSGGRVGREERSDRVGDSDGDELLVGVDLVPVEPTE